MRINEKYFLAPAQRKGMQPILVLYEAPFRRNLQKKTLVQWEPCIQFLWAVAKNKIFIFDMRKPFKSPFLVLSD